MTDVEFLLEHREIAKEVLTLKKQLLTAGKASSPSYIVDGLEQLLGQAQLRLDEQHPRFDQLTRRAPNALSRLVACQYYGMGLTDEAIAETIGKSTRMVNNARNRYLQALSPAMHA